MNTLLYLSYGEGLHQQEVAFSIHTVMYWCRTTDVPHILVYTDHPDFFGDLPVDVHYVSPNQWIEWAGKHNFNHRRKILALKHAMENYPGSMVLLDGDTWLRSPPSRLFERVSPGSALMHIREGKVSEIAGPRIGELQHLIREHSFVQADNKTIRIPADTYLWNAGVIGLAAEDQGLLDEVLDLTDQFCEQANLHILEQFAFSYVLTCQTSLQEAADLVFHYWPPYLHKPFRNRVLTIFQQANRLPESERTNYLFAQRPQPSWPRRAKVLAKRFAQSLGLIRGRTRSNEW